MKNFLTKFLTFLVLMVSYPSFSQIDGFIGEIRIFSGNYAPKGWALCNGQAMQINFYTPLYSVIGTTYGGNGITYFNLPNLNDKIVVGSNGYNNLGVIEGSDKIELRSANIEIGKLSNNPDSTISVATYQILNIKQPSIRLNYIICIQGIYPIRD